MEPFIPSAALDPEREADRALLGLLAVMATSDDAVDPRELAWLAALLPGRTGDDLVGWARDLAKGGMPSPTELARLIVAPEERLRTIRFAARMAWKDGAVADEETQLLDGLADAFDLPAGSVARVLREMRPVPPYDAIRLAQILADCRWDAAQFAQGQLVSPDLAAVMPPASEVVVRVGLENVEVMALCTTGLVARFQEAPAFVAWDEIVAATRGFGLGSAVTLHTESGATFSLVDARLSGLLALIDRMRSEGGPRRSSGVQVTRLG